MLVMVVLVGLMEHLIVMQLRRHLEELVLVVIVVVLVDS